MKRTLTDREEEYESETNGRCKICFTKVIRVNGSNCTCNADGTRYRAEYDNTAWNMFRCYGCGNVISDNFETTNQDK